MNETLFLTSIIYKDMRKQIYYDAFNFINRHKTTNDSLNYSHLKVLYKLYLIRQYIINMNAYYDETTNLDFYDLYKNHINEYIDMFEQYLKQWSFQYLEFIHD